MILWNAILPKVINVKRINYWQAIGILILCRLLFGGFRPGGYGRSGWRSRSWREKWIKMTPEERQKFQNEWKSRCQPKSNESNQQEQ